jgi:hypothetical protein
MTRIEVVSSEEAKELIKELDLDALGIKTMNFCLRMSAVIWAGFINDELAGIWGIIPPSFLSSQAYLWLYSTDVMADHEFRLVRHSQVVIEGILEEYQSIVGHAVMGSDRSIRWLKWLGAKFGSPQGTLVPFRISRDGRTDGNGRYRR